MDRNNIIGFILLGILVIVSVLWSQHEQKTYYEQKRADSIAYSIAHPRKLTDSLAVVQNQKDRVSDTAFVPQTPQNLAPALSGKNETVVLENRKLVLQFATKGAYPFAARMKEYKNYNQTPLFLFNDMSSRISAILPYDNGRATSDLYFVTTYKTETNGDKSIVFTADFQNGKKVDIIYSLPPDDYMMRCSIVLTGMNSNSPLPLSWTINGLTTEKDITNERLNAQIYYRQKNDNYDYFTIKNEEKTVKADGTTLWLGFRKQYFSSALISDEGFPKMETKFYYKTEDTGIVAQNYASLQLPVTSTGSEQRAALRWYIGPNDYNTLLKYKIGMEDMVPLGYGIMAFVKYVNKYALIPLFYFLSSFISNYAIIIMLMTIFIRLILSFFTYKSYLSSAKMRVMKPELDELRAKIGDDQQKFSMEQMKLYRSAGVNPLGGCLPMLFQLPILLSMYYMFPSFIEFRQKSFLWAKDLSTYDSILDFHFNIPMYGDHISLFTLLMTASSLFLALYNKNMTPQDPNNPMMKYMPYIFPIILMGVFNKMAAALTFYYTFSNLLSLVQQFVIQKYFIDEKAIHAKLQENKSKPPVQSKWAQRLEEMQKMQTEKAKVQPRVSDKKK